MFCSYCQAARADNEKPCPSCGAPSPFSSDVRQDVWGGGQPATAVWGNFNQSVHMQQSVQEPQLSLGPSPGWSAFANASQTAQGQQGLYWLQSIPPAVAPEQMGWAQQSATQQPEQAQEEAVQRQSMLPALYNGGMQQAQAGPGWATQQLISTQTIEQMLPAIPEEENTIYVPPMYTRPRPIIPRYRIISGFLSVIIVSLLLCTGAGYYGVTTGKIDALRQLVGLKERPAPMQVVVASVPDPPNKIDKGPAFGIINSATTTTRIDEKNHFALQTERIFQVNQTFYVTYSVVPPKQDGKVTVKWYMNDLFYNSVQSNPIKAGSSSINGNAAMRYSVAAPGKVELYWNDKMAMRLYFSVR
jgi:hypothetical protein